MEWLALADSILGAVKGTFGENVTYTAPGVGSPAQDLRAPFDDAYEDCNVQGVDVVVTRPMCCVAISDLAAAPVKGASLVARSVSYVVDRVELDGHGNALLMLTKA